jgi:uncharacterized membrane protein YgcG
MLDFSMYQSGIDFKFSLLKPSVKALNPLNRLNALFVLAVDRIAKSPYQFNWLMSSAIGLYRVGEGEEEREPRLRVCANAALDFESLRGGRSQQQPLRRHSTRSSSSSSSGGGGGGHGGGERV